MKIAIDALGISKPGGGRSATLNLLQPLLDMDRQNEYILLLDQPEPSLACYGPKVRQVLAPIKQRFAVRAWAQVAWPGLLRRERAQVIHHVKNLTTFFSPCPSVVTIHDLTILAHPEIYPQMDVLYWRTFERFCLNHVTRIVAVSHTTARDLQHFYGLPAQRIVTIPEGIDDAFRPAPPAKVARVRAHYRLPERYLLHVGSISPKKNLATLVRAYGRLRRQGAFGGAVVLAGRPYRREGDPELDAACAGEADGGQIILTGPVPQADLPALYSGAACFVFPTLHEGFGLVPLEAMACGVPVVASRLSATEEVLGDAAILLDDPRDDLALADRLRALLQDTAQQERLCAAGLVRARLFSRQEAARKTLALYQELASGYKMQHETGSAG